MGALPMEDLLTIKAIAQKLGLAESTCRYFRDRFPEYMPVVLHGRRKLYRPEALQVFKVIAEETQKRRSAEETAERLNALFAVNIEPIRNNAEESAAEQQNQLMVKNSENYRLLAQANKEIYFLRELVQQLQRQNYELTRPWWKRIFNQE